MYTDLLEIIHVLGQNLGETQQGLVAMGQKLMGLKETIRNEVLTIANALIQNQTEQEPKTQNGSMARECRPNSLFGGERK